MTETPELWADWVTIWQSEWAALAADREALEAVQRSIDLWAAHAALLPPPDAEARLAGAVPPTRPAAADIAPARHDDRTDRSGEP